MDVIAISNQKGGVGKTTLAFHLAWLLQEAGGRILVVDMDPQGNLSWCFGKDQDNTANEIFERGTIHAHRIEGGPSVVTSDVSLARYEKSFSFENFTALRRALGVAERDFDFVIVDTPPSLGVFTVASLIAATEVIVPLNASAFSMQGTRDLENTIEIVRNEYNHELRIRGYVVNRVQRTTADRDALAMLATHVGEDRLLGIVPQTIKIEEALRLRMPVWRHEEGNPASIAFRDLGMKLTRPPGREIDPHAGEIHEAARA